jgi:hypothetical protein
MSIPQNITIECIKKAVARIILDGSIPPKRVSRDYCLVFKSNDVVIRLPPKYVISVANKFCNGVLLDPDDFNGGSAIPLTGTSNPRIYANDFLESMGFQIEKCSSNLI